MLEVSTSSGILRGFQVGEVRIWKGVPYALAPIGSLRWSNPQEFLSSQNYDANFDSPGCIQSCDLPTEYCPTSTSENCLFLTVTAPAAPPTLDSGYPVMVWIHGGSYESGYSGSPIYNATELALKGSIVVTFNYRLGVMGFLGSSSLNVTGIYGFLDQRIVLKWTRTNIAAFGGNNNSITIAGQDVGALSVAAHIASSISRQYFDSAILQSAPIGASFLTISQAEETASEISDYLGCQSSSTSNIQELQCLRDKTATEILNAQSNAILPFALLKFTPVVDLQGDIDQQPFLVLEKRDFLPLSILGGTVTADGRELANGLLVKNVPETPAEEQYQVTLTELFGEENVAMLQSLYPTVATDSPSEARVDQLGAMLTDYLFFCPLRNLSSLFALDAPVFLYQFNHVPSFGGQSNVCEGYVCNRAELPFVFGSIVPATPSSSEAELSMNLVRSWTNFVNSQDPNIGFQLSPDITFPIYNTSYDGLLVLNLTSMVKRDERASLCAVWDGLGLYPQPLDASLSSAHPSVSPSAHTDNAVSAQLLVLAVVLPLIACILTVALCLINRAYSTGSRRSVLPTLGFSNGQNSSLPLKHFVIEGDETDDEQYANNREL